MYYAVPSQFTASFNRFSNADISTRVSRATQTAVFYIDKEAQLFGSELQDVGLAGWSLSVQHSYDAVAGQDENKLTACMYSTQHVSTLTKTGQYDYLQILSIKELVINTKQRMKTKSGH